MNLKKGDLFTIHSWTSHRDYSWCGDVLKALVIDEPYVVAKKYSRNEHTFLNEINLDLRRIEIMPVSNKYALLNGVPAEELVEFGNEGVPV